MNEAGALLKNVHSAGMRSTSTSSAVQDCCDCAGVKVYSSAFVEAQRQRGGRRCHSTTVLQYYDDCHSHDHSTGTHTSAVPLTLLESRCDAALSHTSIPKRQHGAITRVIWPALPDLHVVADAKLPREVASGGGGMESAPSLADTAESHGVKAR